MLRFDFVVKVVEDAHQTVDVGNPFRQSSKSGLIVAYQSSRRLGAIRAYLLLRDWTVNLSLAYNVVQDAGGGYKHCGHSQSEGTDAKSIGAEAQTRRPTARNSKSTLVAGEVSCASRLKCWPR